MSLRQKTVRLDKLPAVGLPRHEHSLNATLELHLLEPRRTSRLWSRGSGQTTSTLPPIKAGGGAQEPFCGGLLIKLLIEYQYSSPNYSAEAPGGATTLTSAANSIANLSKLDSEEVANAVTICL